MVSGLIVPKLNPTSPVGNFRLSFRPVVLSIERQEDDQQEDEDSNNAEEPKEILDIVSEGFRSSRAREFHSHPPTEPCVKVSPHTALHTQLFVHRHNLGV